MPIITIAQSTWSPTERSRTQIDYDTKAEQALIRETPEGYSVYNFSNEEYLLTFKDEALAKKFAQEYEQANLRRKGVAKVWEKYLPLAEDAEGKISPETKILNIKSIHEKEQEKRDEILAPYNLEERKERHKKLINKGLPHVPEMDKEIEEFRLKPARPHGVELPPRADVPDVPTVQDIVERYRQRAAEWVRQNCKFAQKSA